MKLTLLTLIAGLTAFAPMLRAQAPAPGGNDVVFRYFHYNYRWPMNTRNPFRFGTPEYQEYEAQHPYHYPPAEFSETP
jgi:hypothetical protein